MRDGIRHIIRPALGVALCLLVCASVYAGEAKEARPTVVDPKAAAAESRLLSLMPLNWFKPTTSPKAVVADESDTKTTDTPSLTTAVERDEQPAFDIDEMLKKSRKVKWHGSVGVSMGTDDCWHTWVNAEGEVIPDRLTVGFGASVGRSETWPYWDRGYLRTTK